jgi:nucleotide-binding universal stress UspA family protein
LEPAHNEAIELALALAWACGARIRLFGVAENIHSIPRRRGRITQFQPLTTRLLLDIERRLLNDRLEDIAERFEKKQVAVEVATAVGDPAQELLAAIKQGMPDLVIFASHRRRGLEALMYGSVGQRLAHESAASLLVIPALPHGPPANVFGGF